jgi:hypothetical protein
MQYGEVHEDLLREFPELLPAYEQLLQEEGVEKPGQYVIFEDMFARYIQQLLAAVPGSIRDRKLQAIFDFIDRMLAEGGEVENLGYVGMLEWQSNEWMQAAKPFMGTNAEAALDKYDGEWRARIRKPVGAYVSDRDNRLGIEDIVRKVLSGTA